MHAARDRFICSEAAQQATDQLTAHFTSRE